MQHRFESRRMIVRYVGTMFYAASLFVRAYIMNEHTMWRCEDYRSTAHALKSERTPSFGSFSSENLFTSVSFFPHVLREKAPAGADIRPGIPGCAWRLYCPAR